MLAIFVFAAFSIYADVDKIWARLGNFAWGAFFAALGLAVVNYVLRLIRWVWYLRHQKLAVPTGTASLIFLSGFALSVTPGKVGELIKSYFLKETHDVPFKDSVPIVIAERVADLLALLLLGGLGFALHGIAGTTVLLGASAIAVGLLILSSRPLATTVIEAITSPGFLRRFRPELSRLYEGLADLVRPKPLLFASAVGVLAWLAECVGFALILAGFPGTDISIGLAILIYAVTTVAGALSFLPGGLIVTEATMTLLLVKTQVGLDDATAVSATILTRIATLWFAVLIGLCALAFLRRRSPSAEAEL